MLTMNNVRQRVQFLKPIEDDFKCPVCYEILQEPHLTTCCGNHHLCKVCMENVKGANGRCPFCQQESFTGFIDKRFERQLNELKVYCIYRPKGCDWVGNFGKIEQHLNTDEENGECQFVTVRCPVSVECEENILRKYLKNHINNICIYRRAQCMYCEFVSTYEKITTLHITKCTKYPLLCPNECSDQTYPRDQLDTHLALCPEQEVDCTFSEMGCKEKIKRRVLQEHLDTNVLQHQLIMCQTIKEMKKDKQEAEEQLELLKKGKKEIEEQLEVFKKELENKIQDIIKFHQEDNQIKSLKLLAIEKNQSSYCSKMVELSKLNPVAPLVLKASFQINRQGQYNAGYHCTAEPYKSPFFYSYPNGYKLQLSAEIVCQCSNCVKPPQEAVQPQSIRPQPLWSQPLCELYQPHSPFFDIPNVSHSVETKPSLGVNLYIFKGEYDSQLKWPFKEQVTITTIQGNNTHFSVEKICEGNQNHTNDGIKLGIKSLPTNTPIPLASQQVPDQFEFVMAIDEDQSSFSFPIEDNLLPNFTHKTHRHHTRHHIQSTRNVLFFFEVTFSPQLLH